MPDPMSFLLSSYYLVGQGKMEIQKGIYNKGC